MIRLWDQLHSDDEGSILLALLAILVLTGVATVGLASVSTGQSSARHDRAFTNALNNAESGLDAMVTEIKTNPSQATFAPLSTSAYDASATATAVDKDGANEVVSRTFTVSASGTADSGGRSATRNVQEQVVVANTYDAPVYAADDLNLAGAPSAVMDYDPGDEDLDNNADGANDTPTPLTPQNLNGAEVALPLAGTPGGAEAGPDADLQLAADELGNFDQIADDGDQPGAPDVACQSGPTICDNGVVLKGASPPPADPPDCGGNSGTDITLGGTKNPDGTVTGGTTLDADALPLEGLGVIFNTQITDPLQSLATGQSLVSQVCSSLPIIIPSVSATLSASGLGSELGNLSTLSPTVASSLSTLTSDLLGTVLGNADLGDFDIPTNFSGDACSNEVAGSLTPAQAATPGLTCANDPESLEIDALDGAPVILGTNPLSSAPTIISGEIDDPSGTCTITGNVVLFGTINCAQIVVEGATSSLTVYYDEDLQEDYINRAVTISDYREITQ